MTETMHHYAYVYHVYVYYVGMSMQERICMHIIYKSLLLDLFILRILYFKEQHIIIYIHTHTHISNLGQEKDR